jgi:hypothetical protein
VKKRTVEQLSAVSEHVARFGPQGLMTDRRLTDAAAVDFIQDLVIEIALPAAVPSSVREHFDALRDLHIYGVFQPEFFAMVVTQASLTLEHALGARFIEVHAGQAPLHRSKTGESELVETDDFAALGDRFAGGWRLEGAQWFNGSLASLLRWAHREGLLRGWLSGIWEPRKGSIQIAALMKEGPERRIPADWDEWDEVRRAEWWEETFRPAWERDYLDNERALRNLLAHRTSRFLTMAPDSAQALRSLAAMITSLWDAA